MAALPILFGGLLAGASSLQHLFVITVSPHPYAPCGVAVGTLHYSVVGLVTNLQWLLRPVPLLVACFTCVIAGLILWRPHYVFTRWILVAALTFSLWLWAGFLVTGFPAVGPCDHFQITMTPSFPAALLGYLLLAAGALALRSGARSRPLPPH